MSDGVTQGDASIVLVKYEYIVRLSNKMSTDMQPEEKRGGERERESSGLDYRSQFHSGRNI